MDQCIVQGNASGSDGGGVYMQSGGILRSSLLVNNSANNDGGGVKCLLGGTVENCTIANNMADADQNITGFGGGLCANTNLHINNIIIFNRVFSGTSSNYSLTGSASLAYSCTAPLTGANCLSQDPLFVDTNAANYRISASSVYLDYGTNVAWMATSRDIDGTPRISGSATDLGAYELLAVPQIINTAANGITTNAAVLNGNLLSAAGTNGAFVTIFWGPIDQSTNALFWATNSYLGWLSTGPFSTNITGLLRGSNYFYRCFASNAFGTAWAPASTNFMSSIYDFVTYAKGAGQYFGTVYDGNNVWMVPFTSANALT